MKPVIKYGIIAAAWIVYFIIAFAGSGDGTTTGKNENSADSTAVTQEQNIYADDDVVNDFITLYNEKSSSPLTNISKGNIKTKYYADSYGYYLELLNATDKIAVTIYETNGNTESGVSGMKDVFRDVVKTINTEEKKGDLYTNEQIDSYFESLISNSYMIENDTGLSVSVSFFPDTDSSSGHIKIIAE